MSETMIRTADVHDYTATREKAKPKDEQQEDNDPYCCTPPGGGGGADTKP